MEKEFNINVKINVDKPKLPELTGKEIGRMFKPEMVRAILNLTKIQTRRADGLQKINEHPNTWHFGCVKDSMWYFHSDLELKYPFERLIKPRYQVGDVIYVKEQWAINNCVHSREFGEIIYLSTQQIDADYPIIRKSSMFMPKDKARIRLLVTKVIPERLQDISADDANYEGVRLSESEQLEAYMLKGLRSAYIEKFKKLWIKINGQKSWNFNPWVNVVTFKKM